MGDLCLGIKVSLKVNDFGISSGQSQAQTFQKTGA